MAGDTGRKRVVPEHMEIAPTVREQVGALWARNRLACGWFLRPDFVPQTDEDVIRCARLLMQHGDRQTYVAVRKLLKCR
jgi:hypothetical protein